MMEHRGYTGSVRVDAEAGVLRGRVIDTLDVITFQGQTVEEVRQAFRDSVDDYLEFCAEVGRAPEKPFSGRLLVRTEPALHRALVIEANRQGISVNKLIARALRKAVAPMKVPPASRRVTVPTADATAKKSERSKRAKTPVAKATNRAPKRAS